MYVYVCAELCVVKRENLSQVTFLALWRKLTASQIYSWRKCPWNQNHIFKGNAYLNIIDIYRSFARLCLGLFIHICTPYQYPYIIKIQYLGMCAILSWNSQCIEIFKREFIFLPIRFFLLSKWIATHDLWAPFFPRFSKYISTYSDFITVRFSQIFLLRCFIILKYFATLPFYIYVNLYYHIYLCGILQNNQGITLSKNL